MKLRLRSFLLTILSASLIASLAGCSKNESYQYQTASSAPPENSNPQFTAQVLNLDNPNKNLNITCAASLNDQLLLGAYNDSKLYLYDSNLNIVNTYDKLAKPCLICTSPDKFFVYNLIDHTIHAFDSQLNELQTYKIPYLYPHEPESMFYYKDAIYIDYSTTEADAAGIWELNLKTAETRQIINETVTGGFFDYQDKLYFYNQANVLKKADGYSIFYANTRVSELDVQNNKLLNERHLGNYAWEPDDYLGGVITIGNKLIAISTLRAYVNLFNADDLAFKTCLTALDKDYPSPKMVLTQFKDKLIFFRATEYSKSQPDDLKPTIIYSLDLATFKNLLES